MVLLMLTMLLAGGSALELLLGPDGEYIREIVIDELAKGIDAALRSSFDRFVGNTRQRLLRAFRVSHGILYPDLPCTYCTHHELASVSIMRSSTPDCRS